MGSFAPWRGNQCNKGSAEAEAIVRSSLIQNCMYIVIGVGGPCVQDLKMDRYFPWPISEIGSSARLEDMQCVVSQQPSTKLGDVRVLSANHGLYASCELYKAPEI
jgi:hypothetical protein